MEPKISGVEATLLIIVAIVADLVGLIPIVNIIGTLISLAITQAYFRIKGVKATANLVAQAIDLIPVLSILPATTVGVAIVLWLDRHPKGLVNKVTDLAITPKKPIPTVK